MSTVFKIEGNAYWTLQYEGQVTSEPSGDRNQITFPQEAKAFAHSATVPGKSYSWPWATNDDQLNRSLAGPFPRARVFASTPSKEFTVAHGRGNLIDPVNGTVIYSGDFHRGWFNGFGVGRVYEDTGLISFVGLYKGQWAFGWRHGYGEQTDPDGGIYVGEWKFDRRHGKGKEVDAAGAVYYGCWREGLKHGTGKLMWPNAPKFFEFQQWDAGRLILSRTVTVDVDHQDMFNVVIAAVDKMAADLAKLATPSASGTAALPTLSQNLDPAEIAPSAVGPTPTGPLKLDDKRRLKELQEQVVPNYIRDLSLCVPSPFEIDWESFTNNSSPSTAVWMLAAHDCSWVLKPIKTALTNTLDTEAMKKEFAGIVKKIVLRNKEKLHDTFEVLIEGTTLFISATFSAGATSRIFADKLKAEFDKKL